VDFAGWAYRKAEIPEGATALTHIKMIRVTEGAEGGDLIFDILHQPGSTVGINQASTEHPGIYPNPLKGHTVYVDGMEARSFSFAIYSTTGQLLQEGSSGPGENSIRLNNNSLNQNMVLLKIKNKDISFSKMLNITR
jgi:type IX secretion system substrate protein